jgi:hypothetical protein
MPQCEPFFTCITSRRSWSCLTVPFMSCIVYIPDDFDKLWIILSETGQCWVNMYFSCQKLFNLMLEFAKFSKNCRNYNVLWFKWPGTPSITMEKKWGLNSSSNRCPESSCQILSSPLLLFQIKRTFSHSVNISELTKCRNEARCTVWAPCQSLICTLFQPRLEMSMQAEQGWLKCLAFPNSLLLLLYAISLGQGWI